MARFIDVSGIDNALEIGQKPLIYYGKQVFEDFTITNGELVENGVSGDYVCQDQTGKLFIIPQADFNIHYKFK
jgi:hypothetical protein